MGRLGVLLNNCPRKQRDRVQEFYSNFSPVAALVGEMLINEAEPTLKPVDDPLCLISRIRDNIYLLPCNVEAENLLQVKQALASLLRVIYGIVTWGEGKISKQLDSPISLLRKACTLSLDDPPSDVEWGTWVDRFRPHAKQVWKSQFPSLLLKCMSTILAILDLMSSSTGKEKATMAHAHNNTLKRAQLGIHHQ